MKTTIERLRAVLADQIGAHPDTITVTANFIEDLQCDSLDTVEIIMAVEEEFGIEIADSDAEPIETVGQFVALIDRLLAE